MNSSVIMIKTGDNWKNFFLKLNFVEIYVKISQKKFIKYIKNWKKKLDDVDEILNF